MTRALSWLQKNLVWSIPGAMLLGLLEPTAGQMEVLGVDMLKRRYAALPQGQRHRRGAPAVHLATYRQP